MNSPIRDTWQVHNGGRWCWTDAAVAALLCTLGYTVRLVGPPSTDAAPLFGYVIGWDHDGLAGSLTWSPSGSIASS